MGCHDCQHDHDHGETQGDTWTISIPIRERVDDAWVAYDLTLIQGAHASLTPQSVDPYEPYAWEGAIGTGITIPTPTNGILVVAVPGALTETLLACTDYWFECRLVLQDGSVATVTETSIHCLPRRQKIP